VNRPILLAESAQLAIRTHAHAAHPHETGGILLGVRSGRRPWITHAIELPDPDAGPNHYTVPAGSTRPAIRAARLEDARLGYLGEWHVHPANQGASSLDRQSVLSVLRSVRLASTTLLVARRAGLAYVLDAHAVRPTGLRLATLVLTGDLPPPAESS
jgi:proteasome lid subunit RPN8/RPN11